MKKRYLIFLLVTFIFLSLNVNIFSQNLNDIFKKLEESAFKVNIIARVKEGEDVSVWNMEVSKFTISGKTVNVRLVGDNIVVQANITPYNKGKNKIFLVAQGQVWLSSPDQEGIKYLSTLQSLPVTPGEKVIFYPLGVSREPAKTPFTIEIEIQVVPYNYEQEKSTEDDSSTR